VEFGVCATERNEPARLFLRTLRELCEGATMSDAALSVPARALQAVRYVPEEAPAAPAAETAPRRPAGSSSPWDPGILTIASELRTVDAIVQAVDARRRTAAPGRTARGQGPGASPATETERMIGEAWRRVLRVESLSTTENFFEAGGTSILMAQVAVALHKQGLAVSIVDLLHYPTIASLARHLAGPEAGAAAAAAGEARGTAPEARQLPTPFARLRRHRGR
jgi:aryl carrier-like protein